MMCASEGLTETDLQSVSSLCASEHKTVLSFDWNTPLAQIQRRTVILL